MGSRPKRLPWWRAHINDMKTPTYNKYIIQIAGPKFQCIEANGQCGGGFISPDTLDTLPKLYVVKKDGIIYYVGITTQDIRKRLRYGFSAQGKHGYHGYKWKNQNIVELLIWCFPSNTEDQVEAVEAELVYFIRQKTGKWPNYQMEIHFHQASETEMKVARSIADMCLSEN